MISKFIPVALLLSLTACGGGGGDSSSATTSLYQMSGTVQKGPLLQGSTVWVAELDTNLIANGKAYLAETSDDLGNFSISQNISSQLVDIWASGYYMDELTGNLSTAPITLKAFADLSVDTTPTVNILTTIQKPRLKALVKAGKSYSDAYTQSQNEVISAFGIDSTKITSLSTLYAMQINGTNDQDAVLLAVSSTLAQMATAAATANVSSQAAELSDLLLRIGKDIEASGVITTANLITARNAASLNLNLPNIKSNVESYYLRKGITLVAPKFEEWVDKDNSGVLPRRLIPMSGVEFGNLIDVASKQSFTSSSITISGVGVGKNAYASVSSDLTIIKNGNALNTINTTVKDGDTFAVRLTSSNFGKSVSSEIQIGSTKTTWTLATRMPTIQYETAISSTGAQDDSCGGGVNGSGYRYIAIPITPNRTFSAKYLGVSNTTTTSDSIYVYTNNNGNLGSLLASSTTKSNYFISPISKASGGQKSTFSGQHQYYLGELGASLISGTSYWIVLKVSSWEYKGADDLSTVGFANPMFSNDGTSWTSQSTCRFHAAGLGGAALMPNIWLTD